MRLGTALAALALAVLPGCMDGGFQPSRHADPANAVGQPVLAVSVEHDSLRIALSAQGIPTSGEGAAVGAYMSGPFDMRATSFGWEQSFQVRNYSHPPSTIAGMARLEILPSITPYRTCVMRIALADLGNPTTPVTINVGWTDADDNRLGSLTVVYAPALATEATP